MYYIGSKQTLLEFLHNSISEVTGYKDGDNYTFADLFAGTGVVGSFYKSIGCNVISNDIQYYSYVINKHLIENSNNLNTDIFTYLNSLSGVDGFIYNNYCPGSGSERMYLTDDNGRKCDAIRIEIEKMRDAKSISDKEYYFYLASLINSMDRSANTTSVYGAFLKKFKKTALVPLILVPERVVMGNVGKVYNKNANELIKQIIGDVLYLDPPYNERQYYTQYHLLETVAKYDNPEIHGMTGLRNDCSQKSLYCSKRTIETSFEDIIQKANFKYIFVSYNNEGLLDINTMQNIMKKYGKYSLITTPYRRFKADKDINRDISSNETIEYLHCLEKW